MFPGFHYHTDESVEKKIVDHPKDWPWRQFFPSTRISKHGLIRVDPIN